MAKDINLLPKEEVLLGKDQVKIQKARKLGLFFLGGVAAVSFILLISGQLLINQERGQMAKINNLEGIIENFKEKEIAARLVKDKAYGVEIALEDRIDFAILMDKVAKRNISGVDIDSIDIKKTGEINLTVKAVNSDSLTTYLSNFSPASQSVKDFGGLIAKNISSDTSFGGYKVNLTFHTNELKN